MNMPEDDEIVERVLRQIGTAETPAGMERRILAALEDRTTAKAGTRQDWFGLPVVYGCVLAGVVAIVFAASTMHPSDPLPTAAIMRPAAEPGPVVLVAATPSKSRAAGARTRRAEHPSKAEASTGSETLAASYPAPPMPLTEQEKLLLRIVHKADPEELAMLEPEVRAKLEARSAAEFQAFFPAPSVEENQQNP